MQSAIYPERGETQADFAIRFHDAMRDAIPQTDARNAGMFHAWRSAGREDQDPTIHAAYSRFPTDQYERVRDVPIFAEHTTKARDESTMVYDRDALAAIVDRCNERIADTGDFAALTAGHTPTRDMTVAGVRMPDVLGYSGPFRLGMIGNTHPRWAIFADEYWHKGDVDRLRRLRRRSPEVWLEDRMEDRFMDPIAALGAEAPRLDLGPVRYAITSDGRQVEKYSASFPSDASVFVPSNSSRDSTPPIFRNQSEGGSAMDNQLSPETVQQIVEALMETRPMQWVLSQMEALDTADDQPNTQEGVPDQNSEPAPEPPEQPAPDATPPPPPAAPAPDDDQLQKNAAGDDDDDDDDTDATDADDENAEPATDDEVAELDDDERDAYCSMKSAEKAAYMRARRIYKPAPEVRSGQRALQQMQVRYSKIEHENQALRQRMEALEHEARSADRYSRLVILTQHGYQFDPADEMELVSDFTREQFDRHCERTIPERYSRIPLASVTPTLWTPELPERSRNSKKLAADTKAAIDYATAQASNGKRVSFEEALSHVRSA